MTVNVTLVLLPFSAEIVTFVFNLIWSSCRYRGFILVLTFLFYTAYHLSRKPISIVKSELHRNCSTAIRPADLNITNNATWCDWQPFDQDNYQTLFGVLDNSFLVAYAIGMFFSGIFGERVSLRYYLSFGMVMSGVFTCLFGLGFYLNIHTLWYYASIQILNGLMQTTGWPAVVACVGNWFGKGKRGFIMGVWNSHTSVGNILGSLIAGVFVSSSWGMSFIVPGLIIASTGVLCFFFLIESQSQEPHGHHPIRVNTQLDTHVLSLSCFRTRGCELRSSSAPCEGRRERQSSSKGKSHQPHVCSRSKGVVEFSLCLLFAKLVSYTFLYWLPLYISNIAHFDAKQAGDMSTLFDCGFILFYFHLFLYVILPSFCFCAGMLLLCGGLVNGPYALITTAVSADLGTHECLRGNSRALSTVTAIIDGTGSIGAALGPLFAGLISHSGWNNVFYMLISADVLACLLLSRLVYKEIRGWCGHIPRARG
uniref:Glucose-6-phosphate exchanger SLC37A2 n=1 Tax=Gouania willdenowi TaxID=441366 RepID=A0A8C5GLY4_GOUWI